MNPRIATTISHSVSKPGARPKSKSLQPCRCMHEGCGKMFSKRSNLKAHMRVHNGVLPYPCPFPACAKRFRWKSSLKPHVRVHLASGHVPISPIQPSVMPRVAPTISQPILQPAPIPISYALTMENYDAKNGEQSPSGVQSTARVDEQSRERRPVCESQPMTGVPVSRELFHGNQEVDESDEIDLSSHSVLSNESYQTDVLSFTLGSPLQEPERVNPHLTEQLWKDEIEVIDPFVDPMLNSFESNGVGWLMPPSIASSVSTECDVTLSSVGL